MPMKKTEPGKNPFWDYIGLQEQTVKEGYAELRLDISMNLLQRRGVVHGGVLATMIDSAIGTAVRSTLMEGQGAATVELKVNYVKPAKGEYLVAKAKLSHRGKNLVVGLAEVFDTNRNLIALGTATFIILKS
jgi:uncharacterized protein (TIGR00369 family)